MKILLANWIYNWGSTGYILRDLREGLEKNGNEVVTVCGVNYSQDDKKVYSLSRRFESLFFAVLSRFGGSKFDGSPFATKRFIKIIKKEKPDIVHLHLMHCNCLNLFGLFDFLSEKKNSYNYYSSC